MVDPGHGGKDPGCIGLRGTQEKDIALWTAIELKRHLLAAGRYRVAMTRATDLFVPLEERVLLAQQHNATLFISLHANASRNRAARGASIYTFAERPSDARSAASARRENAADLVKRSWHSASPDVRQILSGLLRRETRSHATRLQHNLVAQFTRDMPGLTPCARHARFAVLRAPDIASTLVELGFLTNRLDEALLIQHRHRTQIAAAIVHAVDYYFASGTVYLKG
jgi:N-acetylmuramoyl-L-alanine amidase